MRSPVLLVGLAKTRNFLSGLVYLTSIQKVLGSIPSWLIFSVAYLSLQEVVRTSDVRVSERTPLNQLRLKPYGPIYNELTGEVL